MTRNRISLTSVLSCILFVSLAGSVSAHATNWTAIPNSPKASNCVLLTDGTVMCQVGETTNNLMRLTPDSHGSYANGTWSTTNITSLPSNYQPRFFCSAVLADGRVIFTGGEYNPPTTGETNLGFIFDPTANGGSGSWTPLTPPDNGTGAWTRIGDAQCLVLPNKKFILGSFGTQIAEFDSATLTYTDLNPKNKADVMNEEGWTLLPSGGILTVDTTNIGGSEYYDPGSNTWTSAGTTPVVLAGNSGSATGDQEMGPQVLRPDGTVVAFGATPNIAIYHSNPLDVGGVGWGHSTTFPIPFTCGGASYPNTGVADGPASILPNGKVLVAASPFTDATAVSEPHCSIFYEFDGSNLTPVPGNPNAPTDVTYGLRMLVLPSGDVLVTDGSDVVELYNDGEPYQASWQPTITSAPASVGLGQTYSISGTQFNGLSAGAYFGDDSSFATNYPLVRITNTASHNVVYARTHDHSTMGVATGSAIVSTNFDVPATIELGSSTLEVVANGIPSTPFNINVGLASTLAFTGASATTSNYNDAATVQAVLTTGGSPLTGKTVTFVLGSGNGVPTCSGVTDGTGNATCSLTPNQTAGPQTLTATFAGDASYAQSIASTGFAVTYEVSAMAFTAANVTTGDYNDPAVFQAQLTTEGTALSGRSVTFSLGSGGSLQFCLGVTDVSGKASCTLTPNQLAGPQPLMAAFSGDLYYISSSASTTFTITREQTALTFTVTSAMTADYHDPAVVQAQLTTDGAAFAGKTVTFVLGSGLGAPTCSVVTNASGNATCTLTPNQPSGPLTLAASYAGDGFYAPAAALASFAVTKEQNTLVFTSTSATVIANGHSATLSAVLKQDSVTPIAGRTVGITLGSGTGAQTCSGTTDATGTTNCTIAVVNQPLGPNMVTANFAGDGFYLPSTATKPVILFAFLAHGSMIVGNLNAAPGTVVEFWGSQWAEVNSLGGAPAPDAFKGFASTSPQACGGAWSSTPSDSSSPPTSLPTYMGVIASSSIQQSENVIAGNAPGIIVVKTSPGYGPAVGLAGTGTVVAVYCP